MKTFYRYIRPVTFSEGRTELITSPRGGVALRFESRADGSLWFTYSRCRADELFSKEVAKRIADSRAKTLLAQGNDELAGRLVNDSVATEVLVEQVIDWCEAFRAPISDQWMVRGIYLEQEYHELARTLELLITANLQEKRKAETYADALRAADFYQAYADRSLD